jgi:hypothetical protein
MSTWILERLLGLAQPTRLPKPTYLRRLLQPLALACTSLFCWQLLSGDAHAQLFGDRRVGAPMTAQPGGAAQNPGNLTGSERYLRGNRSRRDFVGADRSEATGFVGATQAIGVGRVPAATETFRLESTNPARINRPVPPLPAKGMYYPRLEIDFATVPRSQSDLIIATTDRLQKRIQQTLGDGARLTIDGRTARLDGIVDSAQAAELAEILVSFEPGIDQVENRLHVLPSSR